MKEYLVGLAFRFVAVMLWILVATLIAFVVQRGEMPTEGQVAFVMATMIGWEWITKAMEDEK